MRQSMLSWVERYLDIRRKFGYALAGDETLLRDFAEHVDKTGRDGPLTVELALRWARLPKNSAPISWAKRLEVIRGLYRFLSAHEADTQIPPKGVLGPAHGRVQPHIYSEREVGDLLAACLKLSPINGLRPRTYAAMLALVACAGLRTCEALKLLRDDVDWERGLLIVRETKFHKSRLVPLHRSALEALRAYSAQRDNLCAMPIDKNFFLSDRGAALPTSTVHHTFRALRESLGWAADGTGRAPRVYDLRHTFACRRILLWQERGADVGRLLPTLSSYLGHVRLADTYWYLSGTPELLAVVGKRFEAYAHEKQGDER